MRLDWKGRTLLDGFHCAVDEISDGTLTAAKQRLYHKGGQAVSESEGDFPCGHHLRQIARYAGNAMRITWDLNCARGVALQKAISLGSGSLPGEWEKIEVIAQDGSQQTISLEMGKSFTFTPVPLAVLFSDVTGNCLQLSPGFDLWRWNRGVIMTTPPEEGVEPQPPVNSPATLSLERSAEGQIRFSFAVARPQGTAVIPQEGDYRFTMVVAWGDKQEQNGAGEGVTLSFGKYPTGLASLPATAETVVLDFSQMPVCESGLRSDGKACWESNKTIKMAKKCIRQLASWKSEGCLVLRGLSPACCTSGSHCERSGEALHWDLMSILGFVAWTKNALGTGWNVVCPPDVEWAELPASRSLSLPNGFSYGEIVED